MLRIILNLANREAVVRKQLAVTVIALAVLFVGCKPIGDEGHDSVAKVSVVGGTGSFTKCLDILEFREDHKSNNDNSYIVARRYWFNGISVTIGLYEEMQRFKMRNMANPSHADGYSESTGDHRAALAALNQYGISCHKDALGNLTFSFPRATIDDYRATIDDYNELKLNSKNTEYIVNLGMLNKTDKHIAITVKEHTKEIDTYYVYHAYDINEEGLIVSHVSVDAYGKTTKHFSHSTSN